MTCKYKPSSWCCSLPSFIYAATTLTLLLVTWNMVCYSHLHFVQQSLGLDIKDLPLSPSNLVCKPLYKLFVLGLRNDWDSDSVNRNGFLLQGFALPFLFLSALALVLMLTGWYEDPHKHTNKIGNQSGGGLFNVRRGGDFGITFWTLIFVLLPCLYVSFESQFYLEEISARFGGGGPTWMFSFMMMANPTGVAACMALSLFLIPVAKHSPLIKVFGLSFTQALAFHRISGWISLIFTMIHSVLHAVFYGLRAVGDQGFWTGMFTALYPPGHCWSWDVVLLEGAQSGCYGGWRNFFGLLSTSSFMILGFTSLPAVRRRAYWLFYTVHIPMAWIMLIGGIMHYHFIALFLLPNIIYYIASTVPVWIQNILHSRLDKGVNIISITSIANSGGCYQVRLRPPISYRNLHSKGAVCKLCVPEISPIWHPFSVTIDILNGDLLLLVRALGPFTKALLERCLPSDFSTMEVTDDDTCSTHDSDTVHEIITVSSDETEDAPTLLIDGIYEAEYRWNATALQHHDAILLLAGGVGIVPFLTFLPELIESMVKNRTPTVKHVVLHWYCRDEGLLRFVCDQHNLAAWFGTSNDDLRNDSGKGDGSQAEVILECVVHITSQDAGHDNSNLKKLIENNHNDFDRSMEAQDQNQNLRLKTIKFKDYYKNRAWEQSYLISPTSLRRSSFVFALILGSSWGIFWWYYTVVLGENVHSQTAPLGYPVLIIFLIAAAIGIIMSMIERKRRPYFQSVSDHDDHEDGVDTAVVTNVNTYGSRSNGECKLTRQFTLCSGRPCMDNVIAPMINSESPGAFFCGPPILRNGVKGSITKKRRQAHGALVKPCSFYDEQSDM